MTHNLPSPFPAKLSDGRVLLDEICTCGSFRTEHQDTPLEFGHGPGPIPEHCSRFTWVDRVYLEAVTNEEDS